MVDFNVLQKPLPKLVIRRLSIFIPERLVEFSLSKLSAIPHTCRRWSLVALTRYSLASTLTLPGLKIMVNNKKLKDACNIWIPICTPKKQWLIEMMEIFL